MIGFRYKGENWGREGDGAAISGLLNLLMASRNLLIFDT